MAFGFASPLQSRLMGRGPGLTMPTAQSMDVGDPNTPQQTLAQAKNAWGNLNNLIGGQPSGSTSALPPISAPPMPSGPGISDISGGIANGVNNVAAAGDAALGAGAAAAPAASAAAAGAGTAGAAAGGGFDISQLLALFGA